MAATGMKRVLVILGCMCLVILSRYFAFSRWAIRQEALDFFDTARSRPVSVEITVLRDSEMRADAGLITLPVAILSQGNTVKNTEYSFLADVLAARGYLVASIQHDLPTDVPLVTQSGALYVGRLPAYERSEQNIFFAINELKKIQPHADYGSLTMIGHSNGGDISMFFAQEHPELVRMIVTLDNLRVPCLMSGKTKILLFRSNDWKPDPGVVPSDIQSRNAGITVVRTNSPHVEMSDRGADRFKDSIGSALDQFLNDNSNSLAGPRTRSP
jgi:hypothetical protein